MCNQEFFSTDGSCVSSPIDPRSFGGRKFLFFRFANSQIPHDTHLRAMTRSFLAPTAPFPEVLLASGLEQCWDAPDTIGEGNAQPAPALIASPPGFLPGSSIQDADLHVAEGSGTPGPSRPLADLNRCISLRGAVMAPGERPTVTHPGTEGPGDVRILPALAVLRGNFSLRGVLMHGFVSYRVATEGMIFFLVLLFCPSRTPETAHPDACAGSKGNGLAELVATKVRSISTDPKYELQIPRHGW